MSFNGLQISSKSDNLITINVTLYWSVLLKTPPNSGVFLFVNINRITTHTQKTKYRIYLLDERVFRNLQMHFFYHFKC